RDPSVEAAWIGVPTFSKLPVVKLIAEEVLQGKSRVRALTCEKPLARSIKEAREMISLAEKAGLLHGYLENQLYAPSVTKGKEIVWSTVSESADRPYLAKASEEHSGPHSPWFWNPTLAGGGVLIEMMCHCLESSRFLLTSPKETREDLKVRSVSAEIACLKWSRPRYVEKLKEKTRGEIDYSRLPAEDYARATVAYETPDGAIALAECTSLYCYTGPGLRLMFELIGPENSMSINTLQSELDIFFSRNTKQEPGEFLVEKQEAEQGSMPTISDEPSTYGYTAEDRHMVRSFIEGKQPSETWNDGLSCLELIMSCYASAETRRKVKFPPPDLENYVPRSVRAEWSPRMVLEGF
ncbi:MAG TPA: Gfo/Idh/MocA family oxidoreductase, partial [Nitrososphaerales archaeon]|nr:Gfo/Idh/MocA family oxidoreductase [Nitrososphaerales archaeon]